MKWLFAVPLAALAAVNFGPLCQGAVQATAAGLHCSSPYWDVTLSLQQPAFSSLALDGLGEGKTGASFLRAPAKAGTAYRVIWGEGEGVAWIEYRRQGTPADAAPGWRLEVGSRQGRLISQWSEAERPAALTLNFDLQRCHAALLGLMNQDGSVTLPALLHLPNQGSLQITSPANPRPALGYDTRQGDRDDENFVKVTFPAATPAQPRVEFRWEVTAVYPALGRSARDPRLAGFERNWLNILQPSPRWRLLCNNIGSDPCVICMYEYADIAGHAPPLADGLTALDVVRQTLDRYLSGMHGFGLPGYRNLDGTAPSWSQRPAFADAYPSLLIAAADCAGGSGGPAWLRRNYPGVKRWADALLAMDRNGDGLFEYDGSGNSDPLRRPNNNVSNWWDDIGFGHQDAYGNALAYRAVREMAGLAKAMDQREDAARYNAAADRLRHAYYRTFYNPATGVLAGWRSADGQLHDYYFLFVNGAAIHYGLIEPDKANAIMDRLLAKMKEVGYGRFDLGLPGNLSPVAMKDYRELRARFGGGQKEDGSEGFQHYENGGATACFAYFTLAALYDLGRREEADRMLFPMLASFGKGGFDGRAPNGRSYDWKSWDGAPGGYEGFLTDNYYALLAVLAREGR